MRTGAGARVRFGEVFERVRLLAREGGQGAFDSLGDGGKGYAVCQKGAHRLLRRRIEHRGQRSARPARLHGKRKTGKFLFGKGKEGQFSQRRKVEGRFAGQASDGW